MADGGVLLLRRDDDKGLKSKPGSPNCDPQQTQGGCGGYVIDRKPFKFECDPGAPDMEDCWSDPQKWKKCCGWNASGFKSKKIWDTLINDPNLYEDKRPGILVPGFFDLHVHSNQEDILAAYGKALLPWLKKYTIPSEDRSRGDHNMSESIMKAFVYNSLRAGRPSPPTMSPR